MHETTLEGWKKMPYVAIPVLCMGQLFVPYMSIVLMTAAVALFVYAVYKKSPFKVCLIDIFVCVVVCYEIVLCFTGINKGPVMTYMMLSLYSCCFYFICRTVFSSLRHFREVLLYITIVESVIMLFGPVSWGQFKQSVYGAGFDSLYDYRALLSPMGNTINLWGAFLVAFAGNILLTYIYFRGNKKIQFFLLLSFVLLVWNVLATLSRTMYVLLFVVLTVILFALKANRNFCFTRLLCSLFIAVASFCLVNGTEDVIKVLNMNSAVSQQRSAAARLHAMSLVSDSIDGNATFGVGNGNYTLAVNDVLYEHDDMNFTNFVSSGYLQLLTEKGIVGFSIWSILALFLLIILARKMSVHRKLDSFLVLATVVMLLLKEATFAAVQDFPNLQVLFIIPIAGIMNRQPSVMKKSIDPHRFKRILMSAILGMFSVICVIGAVRHICVQRGCPDFMCKTTYNINKSSFFLRSYIETGSSHDISRAIFFAKTAAEDNPKDNILKYNLAMSYMYAGRNKEAMEILEQLVYNFPNNALYRVGLAHTMNMESDSAGCAHQYAAAILSDPRILDDNEWDCMKPRYKTMVMEELENMMQKPITSPIKMAKRGKVSLELGNYDKAEQYLRSALSQLPNLGRAWFNMGVVALSQGKPAEQYLLKARLLVPAEKESINWFLVEGDSSKLFKKKEDYFYALRAKEYYKKYRTWYRQVPEGQVLFPLSI